MWTPEKNIRVGFSKVDIYKNFGEFCMREELAPSMSELLVEVNDFVF